MADRIVAVVALSLALVVPAWANPCALPDGAMPFASGMGGTGSPAHSGMGGTGNPANSGMGGTGIDGGIGGTGLQADAGMGGTGITGSGMGGTGAMADGTGVGGTGVVGVITGFASICVNGLEIHYDASTPVSVDGRSGSTSQLAIGQLVSVQASGHASALVARRIELNSAVAGPVEWVAPGGQSFRVLGQAVRLAAVGKLPAVGEFVRVNGLRDADGGIQATHVERLPKGSTVSVSGPVASASGRTVRIGGLTAVGATGLPAGASVRLSGRLAESGVLEVRQAEIAPEMRLAAKVERMSLQGIVQKIDGDAISLGYARVEANAETLRNVEVGQWVRVEAARRPDGRLDVQRLRLDTPRGGRDIGTRTTMSGRGEARHEPEEGRGKAESSRGEGREGRISEPEETRRKPEKLDKGRDFEKIEKSDKVERVEKIELPEKVELPERVETPERVESRERVERTESRERIERVERRDH